MFKRVIAYRGCTNITRQSALKVAYGRKIPCCTWESNLPQQCVAQSNALPTELHLRSIAYLGPDGVIGICSAVVLVLKGQLLLVKALHAIMILHEGHWGCTEIFNTQTGNTVGEKAGKMNKLRVLFFFHCTIFLKFFVSYILYTLLVPCALRGRDVSKY